jgi:hypothetical protein
MTSFVCHVTTARGGDAPQEEVRVCVACSRGGRNELAAPPKVLLAANTPHQHHTLQPHEEHDPASSKTGAPLTMLDCAGA